jgi:hypothetical protein
MRPTSITDKELLPIGFFNYSDRFSHGLSELMELWSSIFPKAAGSPGLWTVNFESNFRNNPHRAAPL